MDEVEKLARERIMRDKSNRKFDKLYPWIKYYNWAKSRCVEKKPAYKGIKFLLTRKDVKFLWYRDKAYLMKKPSIHRIYSKRNYVLNNCMFIELREHYGLSSMRPVKQIFKDGTFIIHKSIRAACVATNHVHDGGRITSAATGISFGCRWKFLPTEMKKP